MVDGEILVDQSISQDTERLYYEVSMEIAKTLDVEGASAFINLMLVAASQEMIDLRIKDLKELPDDIERMLIGKAVVEDLDDRLDEKIGQKIDSSSSSSINSPSLQEEFLVESVLTSISEPEISSLDDLAAAIDGQLQDTLDQKHDKEEFWSDPDAIKSTDKPGSFGSNQIEHDQMKVTMLNGLDANADKGHSYEGNQSFSISTKGVEGLPYEIKPEVGEGAISTPYSPDKEAGDRKLNGTLTLEKIKKNKGRAISYVGANDSSEKGTSESQLKEKKMAISEAAVAIVKVAEQKDGFVIDFVAEGEDHNNPGYDIHSVNDTDERYIEIKGTDGPWTEYGVSVSPAQINCARINKNKFWLYVVEYAGTPQATLYRIQNPYEKITEFRFDSGWKSYATQTSENEANKLGPQEEMRIILKTQNQSGVISKVIRHGNGKLCKLWIALDNGKTLVDVLYNPATMILDDK